MMSFLVLFRVFSQKTIYLRIKEKVNAINFILGINRVKNILQVRNK